MAAAAGAVRGGREYDRGVLSLRPPRGRFAPTWLALAAFCLGPQPLAAEEAPSELVAVEEEVEPVAPGEGLTLQQAVSAGLADGHSAQIARLEADRSTDSLGEERSAYLPRASITSNAGYNSRQNERLEAVDRSGRQREYGLSSLGSEDGWFNVYLDQLLLDLATWHRIERAELEAEATSLAEAQERELVAFDVLQRFTEVIRQERLVAAARARAVTSAGLDQQSALLLEAGRVRPADREQVALLLAEARLDAEERTLALSAARGALALAMGRGDGPAAYVLDASSLPEARDAGVAEADVEASPEVRVLDLRRRVEEKGVAIARAGHLPTVAVRGGYSHYGVKRFDNYPDALQVGVNVDVPIFEGLRNHYAVDGASKAAEIARLRHRSRLDAKRARVRELSQRLASSLETGELASRRAAVSRERLRLAELNLRADRGTLDEALSALGDSVRDDRLAIDAALDRVLVWAELRREAGTLAQALVGAPPAPN